MCVHYCQSCKQNYSHQEFPSAVLPNGIQVFDPCPFESLLSFIRAYKPNSPIVLDATIICPSCYDERTRWTNDGVHKHSMKEYLKKMEDKSKQGRLTAEEIVQLQTETDNTFQLLIHEMDDDKLNACYNDYCKMMEAFRVRALRFRQLKTDYDIARLSSVTDEEREEFEQAKKRRAAEKLGGKSTAAIRQSKEEKMISSFADKIMAGNPALSREEAVERAKKLFA